MADTRPDGGWGYVVAIAAFMISVILDGVKYSFGILFLELLYAFGGTKSDTSWILSIQISACLIFGPLTGALVNRFGCRCVGAMGALLGFLGFLASAFATSLWFLYISFGLVAGLGFGMMSLPSAVTLMRYFDKHLATAVGFAAMGSGIGTIVFNPLIKILIDEYTWRGTVMIEAGFILNGLVCAAVLVQPPTDKQQEVVPSDPVNACAEKERLETGNCLKDGREFHPLSINTTERNATPEIAGDAYSKEASIDNYDIYTSNEDEYVEVTVDLLSDLSKPLEKQDSPAVPDQIKSRRWISLKPLLNPGFIMLLWSGVLVETSLYVPFSFLPDLMVHKGFQRQDAVWVLFISGILSTVSRVSIGFIADRKCVNRVWLCNVFLIATGILVGICPYCEAYSAFLTFAVIFGFAAGGNSSLRGVLVPELFGIDMIADYLGIHMFFSGFAALIGLPVAGALFDASGTYVAPFTVAGVELVLSGILVFLIPVLCSRYTAKREV